MLNMLTCHHPRSRFTANHDKLTLFSHTHKGYVKISTLASYTMHPNFFLENHYQNEFYLYDMKVQVMTYRLVAFINPKSIYTGYHKDFNF